MDLFFIVFQQVFLMFILMMAGLISYKCHWLGDSGVKDISNLLLYLITPLTIITSYQIPFEMTKFIELGQTFLLSILSVIAMIIITQIVFKKLDSISQYAICFTNCGFMGIPLVKAILGSEAVFHLSAYIVVFNLLCWTLGIYIITKDKTYLSLKKALFNPGTISVVLGMLLFISPIKLPTLLFSPIQTLASLNTPIAMIILGAYIAKGSFKELLTHKKAYLVSMIRLILYPILIGTSFILIPNEYYLIKMVVFIASCAPAGINIMMFAAQLGKDTKTSAYIVSLSSLLSLITMPIILALSNILW